MVEMSKEIKLLSAKGRIGRAKFWAMWLPTMCILIITFVLIVTVWGDSDSPPVISFAFYFASIFACWISIAAQVKRWHDLGISGWMILINLIPLIGGLYALYCLGFSKGIPGPNKYGPNPLGTPVAAPEPEASAG